jgi:hypothetical protein
MSKQISPRLSLACCATGVILISCAVTSATAEGDPFGPPSAAAAAAVAAPQATRAKAPAKPEDRQVFFGEQHLHTRNSPDAFAAGARQSWDEAYQWRWGRR